MFHRPIKVMNEGHLHTHYQFRSQHFLYFLPLPHGHGALRPTFSVRRIGTGTDAL